MVLKQFIAFFLLAFGLLFSIQCKGVIDSTTRQRQQAPKPKYTYTVLKDTPEDARNFFIAFCPFHFDLSKINLNSNYGFALNYRIKNTWRLYAYGASSYFEPGSGKDQWMKSALGHQYAYQGEMTVAYYFNRKRKEDETIIEPKKSKVAKENIKTHCHKMVLKGIRAGFNYYSNGIMSKNVPLTGFDESIARNKRIVISNEDQGTMMKMNMISLGYEYSSIVNAEYELEGSGKYYSRGGLNFYCDILYANAIRYDDMLVSAWHGFNTETYIRVNDDTKRQRWGGRLGIMFYSMNRVSGTLWFEAGIMPGPTLLPCFNLKTILPIVNLKI